MESEVEKARMLLDDGDAGRISGGSKRKPEIREMQGDTGRTGRDGDRDI